MAEHIQYSPTQDNYYHGPAPSQVTDHSMLFTDPPAVDDPFMPNMTHPVHNNPYHDHWTLGELGELETFPTFASPVISHPSPPSPGPVYAQLQPHRQHLSPTDIAPLHTNFYSPAQSSPYLHNNPGMISPSSGYPSSPEAFLNTPATPYPRTELVTINTSGGASPASIDPRPFWPQSKSGRERSHSASSRAPMPTLAGRGPMVPQKRYRPHTTSDRRRYVEEVELEEPIPFFTLRPEMAGFSLQDALSGKFANLAHRDDQMFQDRGPSISVRINWPGYNSWSRQIPTRDFRNPPGPITRAKLAKNVAKSVSRFIVEMTGKTMDEDADVAWQVGPGRIQLSHLALVRLDHVSKGSWQAQLCLVNPNTSV